MRALAFMMDVGYFGFHGKFHPGMASRLGQAIGEFMNITGKIAIGEIAANDPCLQGRFNFIHFFSAQLPTQ